MGKPKRSMMGKNKNSNPRGYGGTAATRPTGTSLSKAKISNEWQLKYADSFPEGSSLGNKLKKRARSRSYKPRSGGGGGAG